MFRGDPQLTGVARCSLPEDLAVLWTFETQDPITSTAAIVDGVVYVGSMDEYFYALDLKSGKLKWKYKAMGAVQSSPLVVGSLVVFGDEGSRPLLGVVTLEEFSLGVDPVNGRLTRVRGLAMFAN